MTTKKILVPIDKSSYEVTIESGILNNIGNKLIELGIKNNRKILIISNSEIAKQILSNWELTKRKFIKVMPIEYKRALEKLAEEKINQIIN